MFIVESPRNHFLDIPAVEGVCESFRLHYLRWEGPDDAPVLLCVHGLTRNAHDFAYAASALREQFTVVSVDMPGRGDSGWLNDKAGYSYPAYVHAINTLLTHLKTENIFWLGTSMGGIIAMVYSAAHPGCIKALVLNDIGKWIPKEAMERIASYAGYSHIFASYDHAENFLFEITAPFCIPSEEAFHYLARHSIMEIATDTYTLACDPEILTSYRELTDDFANITDIDLKPFWDTVDCPVLLLRGEHSDVLLRETADEMATEKNVTFVEFPGIGHAPSLMEDDQVQTIRRWLAWQK